MGKKVEKKLLESKLFMDIKKIKMEETKKLLGTLHFSDRVEEYYAVRLMSENKREFLLKKVSIFEDSVTENTIEEKELPDPIREFFN